MEFFFYCTPQDLTEIFSEIEGAYPLVYQPYFGSVPRFYEIDLPLREPLYSFQEFPSFGRAYSGTPRFFVYTREDTSTERYLPVCLQFSGPPASLTDHHVLCEGSLFLAPENKEAMPRALYKAIKRIFTKRFVKSGYCFLSPSVYADRREYLFIQRDPSFLAPAWCFDETDQHVPVDIDLWYKRSGNLRELYEAQNLNFSFFSNMADLVGILCELEAEYDTKYVELVSQGGVYRENVFSTAQALKNAVTQPGRGIQFIMYDKKHRMFVRLHFNGLFDESRNIVNVSKAVGSENAFSEQLYADFVAKVKSSFHKLDEPHYGPFYLSPAIYQRRHEIILDLNDPRFRIDSQDQAVHVWRKEWEELTMQQG